MPESELVHTYCDAVELSPKAHPIQRAQSLLPAGAFSTARDLYNYTVCSFRADGRPLAEHDSVRDAAWIIFDNVYCRTSGGRSPTNADRPRAARAGFRSTGKGRSPQDGAALWSSAVAHFGPATDTSGVQPLPTAHQRPVPAQDVDGAGPLRDIARPVGHATTSDPFRTSRPAEKPEVAATDLDAVIASALVEPRSQMARLGRPEATVFYSNPWLTLAPGAFYIAGLKPGGDERVPSQTLAKLARWPKSQPWSLYLDEDDWQSNNLQRHIRSFADALLPGGSGTLRNIFSSNAIFAHANDAGVISGLVDQLFAICWPWHERFLNIVRPRTIVTIGNGPESAYTLFASRMRSSRSLGPDLPVYNNFSVKARAGQLQLSSGALNVQLLGLPHLSRCNVASKPNVIQEIRARGWLQA